MFCWGNCRGGRHWGSFLAGEAETSLGAREGEEETAECRYFEIQAGLSQTQLHGVSMPPRDRWEWTQAFGLLCVSASDAASNDWNLAASAVERRVRDSIDTSKLDLLDASYAAEADLPILKTLSDVKIVEANYKEHPQPDDFVTEEDTKNLKYSPAMVGNYKRYFEAVSLYSSENKADTDKWVTDAKDSFFVKWLTGHLKDGHPIIAHTNLWNGHYVVIVGYDNGGTPQLGDDVLIIADPYDTWDHWQDGFIVLPLEKFFYEWNDFNIAAKPYQLQPFVVVGKK